MGGEWTVRPKDLSSQSRMPPTGDNGQASVRVSMLLSSPEQISCEHLAALLCPSVYATATRRWDKKQPILNNKYPLFLFKNFVRVVPQLHHPQLLFHEQTAAHPPTCLYLVGARSNERELGLRNHRAIPR